MAHLQGYTRSSVANLFDHYDRQKDSEGSYVQFVNDHKKKEHIDPERTKLNYNLAPQGREQREYFQKRISEVKVMKRADVSVMASWIVTAPQGLEHSEHKKFFEECYKFLSDKYGEKNVLSAYVHLDEAQPHIHFSFVPIVLEAEKVNKRSGKTRAPREKVALRELIGKKEMYEFHPELSKYMETVFGYDIGIENGATETVENVNEDGETVAFKKNKTVPELKKETARIKKDIKLLEKQETELCNIVEALRDEREREEASCIEKRKEVKELSEKKETLSVDVSRLQADVNRLQSEGEEKLREFDKMKDKEKELNDITAKMQEMRFKQQELTDAASVLESNNKELSEANNKQTRAIEGNNEIIREQVERSKELTKKISEKETKLDLLSRKDIENMKTELDGRIIPVPALEVRKLLKTNEVLRKEVKEVNKQLDGYKETHSWFSKMLDKVAEHPVCPEIISKAIKNIIKGIEPELPKVLNRFEEILQKKNRERLVPQQDREERGQIRRSSSEPSL